MIEEAWANDNVTHHEAFEYVVREIDWNQYSSSYSSYADFRSEIIKLTNYIEDDHPDEYADDLFSYTEDCLGDPYAWEATRYLYHPKKRKLYCQKSLNYAGGCGHDLVGHSHREEFSTLLDDAKKFPGKWNKNTWEKIVRDRNAFSESEKRIIDELDNFLQCSNRV